MAAKAITLKEFAEKIGRAPSYVTKLKQTGRLVFSRAGRVKVKESLALIEQTAGNRGDVAQRHQAQRAESEPAKGNGSAPSTQEISAGMTLKDASIIKAFAESRRVAALADKEEMERDRLAGDLIAREDVDAAMKFIGASVRGLLDVFPDQVAPLVAPVASMDECHALLTENCRNVLVGLGDAIKRQCATLDGAGD